MNEASTLHIPSSGAQDWFNSIVKKIPHEITTNGIVVDNSYAHSEISLEELQQGLSYALINLETKKAFSYQRSTQIDKSRFSIIITLNQVPFTVTSEAEEESIMLDHPAKAMVLSPKAEISINFPPNAKLYLIIIFLDEQWISKNLADEHNENVIFSLLQLKRPAVMYQMIESNYQRFIHEIIDGKISRILKLSTFVGLISHIFTQFLINEEYQKRKIKDSDADKIIKVISVIEENFIEMPSLEHLAKRIGMSLSKFKYSFKYVTGLTPYQYYLKYKMKKAMDLILNTDRSISEVGYICGYTNLSHFSRVFKRFHGVLPSQLT